MTKKLNLDEDQGKLPVVLKGKEYQLSYPAWGDIEDIEKKGENIKVSEVIALLDKCGLPEEQSKQCNINQLLLVYKELLGLKKD